MFETLALHPNISLSECSAHVEFRDFTSIQSNLNDEERCQIYLRDAVSFLYNKLFPGSERELLYNGKPFDGCDTYYSLQYQILNGLIELVGVGLKMDVFKIDLSGNKAVVKIARGSEGRLREFLEEQPRWSPLNREVSVLKRFSSNGSRKYFPEFIGNISYKAREVAVIEGFVDGLPLPDAVLAGKIPRDLAKSEVSRMIDFFYFESLSLAELKLDDFRLVVDKNQPNIVLVDLECLHPAKTNGSLKYEEARQCLEERFRKIK